MKKILAILVLSCMTLGIGAESLNTPSRLLHSNTFGHNKKKGMKKHTKSIRKELKKQR
jgi:hypothetical protein